MANEMGVRNVAFEVNDLQAAVDQAAADGYGLVGGARHPKPGGARHPKPQRAVGGGERHQAVISLAMIAREISPS